MRTTPPSFFPEQTAHMCVESLARGSAFFSARSLKKKKTYTYANRKRHEVHERRDGLEDEAVVKEVKTEVEREIQPDLVTASIPLLPW